jgi:pimeloyl-ACP methyl ester carboxylesterase
VFEGLDIRATIGATVEAAAPHDLEPDIWEDYVSAYEDGRFAQSTLNVRSYPDQLPLLRDLLPGTQVPVHVFASDDDPLVPVSNGRYLAERIPGSELTILTAAGHFAWEQVFDQFAGIVADWVTHAGTGVAGSGQ